MFGPLSMSNPSLGRWEQVRILSVMVDSKQPWRVYCRSYIQITKSRKATSFILCVILHCDIWRNLYQNRRIHVRLGNSELKSKESDLSAKPIPMYAFLPSFSTRTTKYRDESRTASTEGLVMGYSARANTKTGYLNISMQAIMIYTYIHLQRVVSLQYRGRRQRSTHLCSRPRIIMQHRWSSQRIATCPSTTAETDSPNQQPDVLRLLSSVGSCILYDRRRLRYDKVDGRVFDGPEISRQINRMDSMSSSGASIVNIQSNVSLLYVWFVSQGPAQNSTRRCESRRVCSRALPIFQ